MFVARGLALVLSTGQLLLPFSWPRESEAAAVTGHGIEQQRTKTIDIEAG